MNLGSLVFRRFYEHIKARRVDPSYQSVNVSPAETSASIPKLIREHPQNPTPDYYGKCHCSPDTPALSTKGYADSNVLLQVKRSSPCRRTGDGSVIKLPIGARLFMV